MRYCYIIFGQNVDFKAFTPSSVDDVGPEIQFFKIIDLLKASPVQYLDLIELAYYCLITGFEGQYHTQANGRQILDNLIDELHQLITQNRVYKNHLLFNQKHTATTQESSRKPLIYISIIFVCLLSLTYTVSNKLLENKVQNVLYKNNQHTNVDD